MITRRALLLTTTTGLLAVAASRAGLAQTGVTDDPRSILNAVYNRVTRGKGDSGGGFVTLTKSARARYLSRSFAALWLKAESRVPKGDGDPVGFDPVTNSQDPDVKSFTMATENFNSQRATIAVTITGHNASRANPTDAVIRYDFVRDPTVRDPWKIDEIRGAVDVKPWSVRALLTDSLKY
jgi:hypothetical protein